MDTGDGADPVDERAAQAGATAVVVCDHRTEPLGAGQLSIIVPCRSIRTTLARLCG
jgi:hypothetical protein